MKNVHGNAMYTHETETQGGQRNQKAMQGVVLHVNNIFKVYTGETNEIKICHIHSSTCSSPLSAKLYSQKKSYDQVKIF